MYFFGQGPWGVKASEAWFIDPQRTAFEESRAFWHEVPDDPQLTDGSLLIQYGLSAELLSVVLDQDTGEQLNHAASLVAVDPATLEGLRPWLAAQALDHALRAQVPSDELLDVESVLTEVARSANKAVHAEFASAEAVISSLANYGAAEVDYLLWTVDRVTNGVAEMTRQANAWMAGDLSVFAEDVANLQVRWPRLFEVLLRERNRRWLPRIDAMLAEPGSVFVLVGMSHLVGNDSVLHLLASQGLEAQRLN